MPPSGTRVPVAIPEAENENSPFGCWTPPASSGSCEVKLNVPKVSSKPAALKTPWPPTTMNPCPKPSTPDAVMEEVFKRNDTAPETQKLGMGANKLNCHGAANVAVAPVPAMVDPPTKIGLLQATTAVARFGATLFRVAEPAKIIEPVKGTA